MVTRPWWLWLGWLLHFAVVCGVLSEVDSIVEENFDTASVLHRVKQSKNKNHPYVLKSLRFINIDMDQSREGFYIWPLAFQRREQWTTFLAVTDGAVSLIAGAPFEGRSWGVKMLNSTTLYFFFKCCSFYLWSRIYFS